MELKLKSLERNRLPYLRFPVGPTSLPASKPVKALVLFVDVFPPLPPIFVFNLPPLLVSYSSEVPLSSLPPPHRWSRRWLHLLLVVSCEIIFLLYTGTSPVIIYISNVQRTQIYKADVLLPCSGLSSPRAQCTLILLVGRTPGSANMRLN